MMSWSGLRPAIITGELKIPALVETVAKNVGVWLLIVLYPKKTVGKRDGDSLVV